MTWFITALIIGLIVYWFIPKKPKIKKINVKGLSNLGKYFDSFSDVYTDGSELTIQHIFSKKIIKFINKKDDENNYYLLFGFPDGGWLKDNEFEKLKKKLDEDEILYWIDKEVVEEGDDILQMLFVNPFSDARLAEHLTQISFTVMNIPINDHFEIYVSGYVRTDAPKALKKRKLLNMNQ